MFNNFFFFENHAVYEMMWKMFVELGRPQMTMWRMPLQGGYLRLQTHTHSEYVILIVFSRQQWAYERSSMLRHTYIASLINSVTTQVADFK